MKINYFSAIIAAIMAIIFFCIIAVVFNVMPVDSLPVNFIGATLGALIGALITLVLLKGQKAVEEEKDKNIRILEKKTEIFQQYIKDVWEVWKEQKITLEKFQELASNYYQNLMIYLKNNDRLEKIGTCLSEMGHCITNQENTKHLRTQIVSIIDVLSEELEFGGKINTNIMEEHDRIVFPLLLKNEILKSLNNYLPTTTILEKGRYEYFREGSWNLEHICFNFKEYSNCKIVIGAFNGRQIWFVLVIDVKYQLPKGLRDNGIYIQRIVDSQKDLANPVSGGKDFEELDKEKAPELDFSDNKSMEIYRTKKRNFAEVLANRACYWFSTLKIEDKSIMEFLDHYIKQGA
jgi:hypothetical protein